MPLPIPGYFGDAPKPRCIRRIALYYILLRKRPCLFPDLNVHDSFVCYLPPPDEQVSLCDKLVPQNPTRDLLEQVIVLWR